MSDYDRSKFHTKKKFHPPRDTSGSLGRSFFGSKSELSPKPINIETTPKKQPTILIKTREKEPSSDETTSVLKRNQKDEVSTNVSATASKENEVPPQHSFKQMIKSLKLIDEGIICTESLQDYIQDNSEFLVVGVVGPHGVGKSTILNLLIQNQVTEDLKKVLFKSNRYNDEDGENDNIKLLTETLEKIDLKPNEVRKEVFKIETPEDIEEGCNKTQGIDIYITPNRLILLECQPFTSVSILEDLIKYENKRTNLVSEFIPLENSGEIQGLQYTTFLMSVCHVLLIVQDWFFDSNIVRFIQTAEMLKPTIPNPEEEITDHFPHLLLVQNRAQMSDFSPSKFKSMQQTYKMLFHKSKLNIKSGLGLGTGRLINSLNTENCGTSINLFLIPEVDIYNTPIYNGHPPLEELIKKLRSNILGATRNHLTHVQLTEKTWLIYCSKVWDTVKKSSFFVEYMKLMP